MVITNEDLKNIYNTSTVCTEGSMLTFIGKFSSIDEAKNRCKGASNHPIFMVEGKTYIYFSEDRIEEYCVEDSFFKFKELLLINNMITYNIKEEFDTNKLKYILDNMKEYLELKNLSECIRVDIINSKPQFIYKNGEQII